jgi:chemosensory pili system protein ChpA (sensor histidine kinase/response regulator)
MNDRPLRPVPDASRGEATADPILTVMIVDDVQDIRDLYERFFEMEGARVITAESGVSALQVVLVHRPDAIVLDIAMPLLTGNDVIRSLKGDARTRTIPIVVVSGQHDAKRAALEAGADAYLQKPVLPDRVFAEVQRVLRAPRRRRTP